MIFRDTQSCIRYFCLLNDTIDFRETIGDLYTKPEGCRYFSRFAENTRFLVHPKIIPSRSGRLSIGMHSAPLRGIRPNLTTNVAGHARERGEASVDTVLIPNSCQFAASPQIVMILTDGSFSRNWSSVHGLSKGKIPGGRTHLRNQRGLFRGSVTANLHSEKLILSNDLRDTPRRDAR